MNQYNRVWGGACFFNMDEKKILFLIKPQGEDELQDKTRSIFSYQSKDGNVAVQFYGNEQTYRYRLKNCFIHIKPKHIDSEDKFFSTEYMDLNGFDDVVVFGEFYKFFYPNFTRIIKKHKLIIQESCLKKKKIKGRFEYLKSLSKVVDDTFPQDDMLLKKGRVRSGLFSQYEKVEKIHPQSFLRHYLEGRTQVEDKGDDDQKTEKIKIFPFRYNSSQRSALKMALQNQSSIIVGPPGTGKTQTILNIISNIVYSGQKVAVVSNNNSAVDNIYEKLCSVGLDRIVAPLGKRSRRDMFFQNQKEEDGDFSEDILDEKEYVMLEKKIKEADCRLELFFKKNDDLSRYRKEYSALQKEQTYFDKIHALDSPSSFCKKWLKKMKKSKHITSLLFAIETFMTEKDRVSFFHKTLFFWRYRRMCLMLKHNMALFLKKEFYLKRQKELGRLIKDCEDFIERVNGDLLLKTCCESSLRLMKHHLGKKERKRLFSYKNYKILFDQFLNDYPVILSTTHSFLSSIKDNYVFDYLIVDESSQVDIVSGALNLSHCKHVIFVGDLKQLSPIVSRDLENSIRELTTTKSLTLYDMTKESLLSSVMKVFKDQIPQVMLKEHYRCVPPIIEFCNQKYYDEQLIIKKAEQCGEEALLVIKTPPGRHERTVGQSRYNERQIDVLLSEVLPLLSDVDDCDIGIITPYRLQAKKITERLGERMIECDTIHRYQGREKEVIIFSSVLSELNSFIDDMNIVNVAISRAKSKFIFIAPDECYREYGSHLGDFIRYIEYQEYHSRILESRIVSVFDCLYKHFSECLKSRWSQMKKVSFYQSENIMNQVLEEILAEPSYHYLKHVLHVPLRSIIRINEDFSKEDVLFIHNPYTHVDFLLYNRYDKLPFLAIEVDGVSYHENNQVQQERDTKKDRILCENGLPVLRLKTNESRIKEKVKKKIQSIATM